MQARAFGSFAIVLVGGSLSGCDREPPPGADPQSERSTHAQPGDPTLPHELRGGEAGERQGSTAPAPTESATSAPAEAPVPPHPGPWLAVTTGETGVYSEPTFDKKKKIGWVRNGGKVPVQTQPVAAGNCSRGWYRLISGGYICGNAGTTDLKHSEVRLALKPPNFDDILPYRYARNSKNGTPLYKSVPSREQMHEYEPYLESAKRAQEKSAEKPADAGVAPPSLLDRKLDEALADAGILLSNVHTEPEPEKPWWQREDAKDKLHELKLQHLESEADGVLSRRMVSGFYVAVDRSFSWNGRTWYKTTKNLVAPSDRFWQTPGPKFQGVEIEGDKWRLPIGWVYGGRKSATLYEIDDGSKNTKPSKDVERYQPIALSGREVTVGRNQYRQTRDGLWIKDAHIRVTNPNPPPADLGPTERWLDVNLTEQTLVAFEGTRAVYATLTSTGKESKIKEKDHRTPTGEWRIREKHVTTTMDGDGSAAGDLPYSIEDVPYAMYYHRSYAVHGAFWHQNFGIQMSHGCVNLSPLDAKRVFFFSDPPLPEGLHGVWSSEARPGSRVVVHE